MTTQRTADPSQSALLRSVAIFGGLRQTTLELLLSHAVDESYPEGSYFFREGDQDQFIFVLHSGTAIVERCWDDEAIILGRLQQGDCFGEMSLIDFQCRSASVKAECDCEAIKIPFRAIRILYKEDFEQYTMVMLNLGREVSRRLRLAGDRLFQFQQELGRQWFDEQLTGDT